MLVSMFRQSSEDIAVKLVNWDLRGCLEFYQFVVAREDSLNYRSALHEVEIETPPQLPRTRLVFELHRVTSMRIGASVRGPQPDAETYPRVPVSGRAAINAPSGTRRSPFFRTLKTSF